MTPEQFEQVLAQIPEAKRERVREKLMAKGVVKEAAPPPAPVESAPEPAPKPVEPVVAAPKPVAPKPPPKPKMTLAQHPLMARAPGPAPTVEQVRAAEEDAARWSEHRSTPTTIDGATEQRNVYTDTNFSREAAGRLNKLISDRIGAGMTPEEAEKTARADVFGAIAPDEERKPLIPTVYPEEMREKVRKGEGTAGQMVPFTAPGAWLANEAYKTLTGHSILEDAGVDTADLAPFFITMEPGFSASADVDPEGRPVGMPSQDSPVWNTLKSPIERVVDPTLVYAFGTEDMKWGDDEHLRRLQFGEDALSKSGDIGSIITKPYEMLGLELPEMAKRASGASLVVPLLFLDPTDPLSASIGVLGEGVRALRSAFNFERRSANIGAEIAAKFADRIEAGDDMADVAREAAAAGTIDERVFRAAQVAARADLANKGATDAAVELADLARYRREMAVAQEAASNAAARSKAARDAYTTAKAGAVRGEDLVKAAEAEFRTSNELLGAAQSLAQHSETMRVAADVAKKNVRIALANLKKLAKVVKVTETGAKAVRFTGSASDLRRMVEQAGENRKALYRLAGEYRAIQGKGASATAQDAARLVQIRDEMADVASRTLANSGDAAVAKAMVNVQAAGKGAAQASVDAAKAFADARGAAMSAARSPLKRTAKAKEVALKQWAQMQAAARKAAEEALRQRGFAKKAADRAAAVADFRNAVVRELRGTADSMKAIAEGGTNTARGRNVLRAVEDVPLAPRSPFRYGGATTAEAFIRLVGLGGLRASRRFIAFDPIAARGFGATTEVVKQIARRGMERYPALQQELDAVLKVSPNPQAIIDYLRGVEFKIDGGRMTALNRQIGGPLNEALQHLKMAAGDDQAWKDSVVAVAIARSWNVGGLPNTNVSAKALEELRALVLDAKDGEDLLNAWMSLQSVALDELKRSDSYEKSLKFFAQAVLAGSNLNEMVRDVVRGSGPLLSDDVRRALNFVHEQDATTLRALKGASVDVAEQAAEKYGIGAMKNDYDRYFVGPTANGVGVANQLMRMTDDVYVPTYIWKAMQDIPQNIAKQLDEYNQKVNRGFLGTAWDMVRTYHSTWRLSSTVGIWIPKFHQAAFTPFGDWNQMSMVLGFGKATRLAAGNLVAAVPFLGADAYARLSRSSVIPGLINPMMDPVLRADPKVALNLHGGVMTAEAAMKEALAEGVWQSQSGEMLREVTSGAQKSFFQPSQPVKAFTGYLEAVQLRQRLALYLDLRQTMPAAEAGKQMREALFDWRLAQTPWEQKSFGNFISFWNYRKNAFSQLAMALAEGYTAPDYWSKMLRGDTKVNRLAATATARDAIRNVTAPMQDPEEVLTDQEQLDYAGTRELPWYNQAMSAVMTRVMDPERRQWESERALRNATHEAIYLPAAQTLDDARLMADVLNMAAASFVWASRQAGFAPEVTSEEVDDVFKRGANDIADSLLPLWKQMLDIGTATLTTGDALRPTSVSRNEAVFYTRFVPRGMEAFAEQTPHGTWRYKNTAAAQAVRLLAENPIGSNLIQTWAVFDNPSAGVSVSGWLAECMSRWTGAIRVEPFDPGRTRDIDRELDKSNVRQLAP